MVYCPKCGAANADGSTKCGACGTEFQIPNQMPGYGMPNQGFYQQPVAMPGKGFATAGLVCGIISFFFLPIILSILAIIFGGVAKSKGFRGGMATAAIVLGIIALALTIILLAIIGNAAAMFFAYA